MLNERHNANKNITQQWNAHKKMEEMKTRNVIIANVIHYDSNQVTTE